MTNSDLDPYKIKKDFPVFEQENGKKPLIFLDSAASAQKPKVVIERLKSFYETEYANVHRGIYQLSDKATTEYEKARTTVASFLGAESSKEIIFTRNATEAINLVAATYGRKFLNEGDEIIVSEAEHHANLVPWQQLRDEKKLKLTVLPIADDGSYIDGSLEKIISNKTKLVAITQMSNVLGSIFPVKKIAETAHSFGAKILIDGCQAAVHLPIDVRDLNCDFYVFSGHKTYGPSGIGVLYGKYNILEEMPPYQYGGDMVASVSYETASFHNAPARFEAGTPAIAQAVGLGAALEYMEKLDRSKIATYETDLVQYAMAKLQTIKEFIPIGTAKNKSGVVTFVIDKIHSNDIATLLDQMGIAVRTGHHCAEPLIRRMGHNSTIRASFAVYNTREDVDALYNGLVKAISFF
ncbi:MAG: aminotransferase class V-fold PLP-dependent enzyme [Alphaproteobacteria bacterium]